MWIIYAFLAALFAGITSILAKIGITNTDSHVATALRTIVIVIFAWIMVFVVGAQNGLANVSQKSLTFLVLSGVTTGASWICYFKALQLGDINKVVPIDKSSTILTMVLAFVFLKEPLHGWKVVSMALIGVGTYLMIAKAKTSPEETITEISNHDTSSGFQMIQQLMAGNKAWLAYALASALFASMTAILGKIGVQNVNSNLAIAIRTIVVLLMAWLIVFGLQKQKHIKNIDKKSWLFIGLSGIATGLSWLFYYRALQDGLASVVVPIDKLSMVVSIAFGYVVFKERLTIRSLIGLGLIVSGTLLLLV